jgi:hypothetical protein
LDGFGDLPDEERAMLFETFRAWQDNGASVRGAAFLSNLPWDMNHIAQRARLTRTW